MNLHLKFSRAYCSASDSYGRINLCGDQTMHSQLGVKKCVLMLACRFSAVVFSSDVKPIAPGLNNITDAFVLKVTAEPDLTQAQLTPAVLLVLLALT